MQHITRGSQPAWQAILLALTMSLILPTSCASEFDAQPDDSVDSETEQTEEALIRSGQASYHIYTGVRGDQVACAPAPGSNKFNPANFDYMVTALTYRLYDSLGRNFVCSRCARVTHNGKSVTVRVIDRMTHPTRELDLSKKAFSRLANPAVGEINVRFEFIACPPHLT